MSFSKASLSPWPEPMSADEVQRTASSAWRKTERDENWFGQGKFIIIQCAVVDRLGASDPPTPFGRS